MNQNELKNTKIRILGISKDALKRLALVVNMKTISENIDECYETIQKDKTDFLVFHLPSNEFVIDDGCVSQYRNRTYYYQDLLKDLCRFTIATHAGLIQSCDETFEAYASYEVVESVHWLNIINMTDAATLQARVVHEDYLSIQILLTDDEFNPELFKELLSQRLSDNWSEHETEVDELILTINEAVADEIEVLYIYSR